MAHERNQYLLSQIASTYKQLIPKPGSKIGNNVITQIPPTGLTLAEPGTYTFGQDVVWGGAANTPAIVISSSNVTLDFNNFNLFNTTSVPLTSGVLVSGTSNVSIKNGGIYNMSIAGIVGVVVNHIVITNMKIHGLTHTDPNLPPIGIFLNLSKNI